MRVQSHRPTRPHQTRETPNKVGCGISRQRKRPQQSSGAQGGANGHKISSPSGAGPSTMSRKTERRDPSPIREIVDARPAAARKTVCRETKDPSTEGERPVAQQDLQRGGRTTPEATAGQERRRDSQRPLRRHPRNTHPNLPSLHYRGRGTIQERHRKGRAGRKLHKVRRGTPDEEGTERSAPKRRKVLCGGSGNANQRKGLGQKLHRGTRGRGRM